MREQRGVCHIWAGRTLVHTAARGEITCRRLRWRERGTTRTSGRSLGPSSPASGFRFRGCRFTAVEVRVLLQDQEYQRQSCQHGAFHQHDHKGDFHDHPPSRRHARWINEPSSSSLGRSHASKFRSTAHSQKHSCLDFRQRENLHEKHALTLCSRYLSTGLATVCVSKLPLLRSGRRDDEFSQKAETLRYLGGAVREVSIFDRVRGRGFVKHLDRTSGGVVLLVGCRRHV